MSGLILLDRDGVLNALVVDPDHGTINSPLHPSQVEVFPWAAKALRQLNEAGYGLAIVSNQPAWAKGTTTKSNLEQVHQKIVQTVESEGARILSSHLCLHRHEDGCDCRKPKPGLLQAAISQNPQYARAQTWMVGDGITDMQAANALQLKTAFLGPKKCDACKIFDLHHPRPLFWGNDLRDFVEHMGVIDDSSVSLRRQS